MANSTTIRVPILILILLVMHMTSADARTFHELQNQTKFQRVDSSSILSNLLKRYKYDYRRKMGNVRPTRVTPAGPDPQHHSQPPTVA